MYKYLLCVVLGILILAMHNTKATALKDCKLKYVTNPEVCAVLERD